MISFFSHVPFLLGILSNARTILLPLDELEFYFQPIFSFLSICLSHFLFNDFSFLPTVFSLNSIPVFKRLSALVRDNFPRRNAPRPLENLFFRLIFYFPSLPFHRVSHRVSSTFFSTMRCGFIFFPLFPFPF